MNNIVMFLWNLQSSEKEDSKKINNKNYLRKYFNIAVVNNAVMNRYHFARFSRVKTLFSVHHSIHTA